MAADDNPEKTPLTWSKTECASAGLRQLSELCLQARGQRGGAEVCQSVSGKVRGSPKRVMTLVLKPVMDVMWSPAVVMTRRL